MAIPAPQTGSAALITGASSGIGAELARQLCARGHDPILVARRRERLEELAIGLRERHGRRVDVLACDVADAGARERLAADVSALGLRVEVLVLSAGFGMGGPFLSQEPDRIVQMTRTNLEGVFALTRALLPAMAERRRGAVLIVSSLAGNQPMPNFGAYAATKAAATSFAQSLSCELAPYGITVTALCPGGVRTEFSDVAGTAHKQRELSALIIGPEEAARAGIEGLERGRRIVMPRRGVRLFAFVGAHAPRALWLPLCRKLMA
jgi:short-subunit dehydrogenase